VKEPRLPILATVLASVRPLIDWHKAHSQIRRLAVTTPQYARLQKAAAETPGPGSDLPRLVQEDDGVRYEGFLLYPQLAPTVTLEKVAGA
jgi:hypothetical protein